MFVCGKLCYRVELLLHRDVFVVGISVRNGASVTNRKRSRVALIGSLCCIARAVPDAWKDTGTKTRRTSKKNLAKKATIKQISTHL